MSKRSWMEDQCFRMCSAEGVECICLKEIRNKHTGSSMDEFMKAEGIEIDPTKIHDAIEGEAIMTPKQRNEDDTN